jgi:hypothetical protein
MFLHLLYDLPGNITNLFHLPDSAFYHLLGLLTVIGFLRLFIPLHCIMAKELKMRNEVADLAEEIHCTEFDIFVKAHKYYFGTDHPVRIKNDFITYLCNWPDNYILPFYMRNFLADLERDNPVSAPPFSKDKTYNPAKKLKTIQ